MEKELEEEGAEGKLAAWLVLGGQPGGKTHGLNGEAWAWQSGRLLLQGERGWLAEGRGMGGYAHVGLQVGCEQRRTLSRHCNAAHRCLLTLLLHLRDTCCLAKGDLNVQHLKEVHPISGCAVAFSGWGWLCLLVPETADPPQLLIAHHLPSMTWGWKEAFPGKISFQTGRIKGSSVFIHKSDYNSRKQKGGVRMLGVWS